MNEEALGVAGGVGAAVREGGFLQELSIEDVAMLHLVPQMLLLLVGVQTGSPKGLGRRLHVKDNGWTLC